MPARLASVQALLLMAAAVLLLGGGPDARAATTPTAIAALPVVDPFATPEDPLSGGGAWTQMITATYPGLVSGSGSTGGWGTLSSYPVLNGALWNSSYFTGTGSGVGVAATLSVMPTLPSRHFALWLDMPYPGHTGSTGYELRFTHTDVDNVYDVTLTRWQAGIPTVLDSETDYPFPEQSSFALADDGGTVSAWTDTGSGYGMLLSTSDAALDSGSVGIAASGNYTRIRGFSAGTLDGSVAPPPPIPPASSAVLKAVYPLAGDRLSAIPGPALTDIGAGNQFAVETVDGVSRPVLTFPRGGGLSLSPGGLVDPDNYSVAMLLRLADRTGFRRILDFSDGTSDNGLYSFNGRAALYPLAASTDAVFDASYAHVVLTYSTAGGVHDTTVYVDGDPVVTTTSPLSFGLGSGVLRFFKDNVSGPYVGEDSAGAVACVLLYSGALSSAEVGELPTQPPLCDPPPPPPDPDPDPDPDVVVDPGPAPAPDPGSRVPPDPRTAPGARVGPGRAAAYARRKPRAKRWRGSVLVDTGLTVSCARGGPCTAGGRLYIAPRLRWVGVGSVRLALATGARRKVVVALSPRGVRALRRAGKLKVRTSASVTTAGRTKATARQTGWIGFPSR